MASNPLQVAESYLFALFVMLASGALASRLAERLRLPDIVLHVLVGFLLGPSALDVLRIPEGGAFHDAVLSLGAAWIVFQGGLEMRFQVLRRIWLSVLLLATLGLAITAAVVGVAAHVALGLPMLSALLLGSLLASTDPASLVPIFQRLSIRARVAQAVIAESAFTDATGAMLTALVLTRVMAASADTHVSAGDLVGQIARLALGGAVIGAAFGLAAAWLISRYAPPTPGGRSLYLVLAALGSYASAAQLGASGFMASFVAGMALVHAPKRWPRVEEPARALLEGFVDGMSLQFRMLIFISLGSQLSLRLLAQHVGVALIVVAVFMLVARPLTVLASLLPDRQAKWSWREIAFFFWVRETGTIAIALAGLVQGARIPGAQVFTQVAATAVLITLLVQASTTPLVARWLRLIEA
ncbi:sodium:proton antiporter [Alicyclobacillus mali]|uniref:Sodium:proton antiporter n=1 Tax=Alicyclobacillus mali (ex Roth et al. 2021) TaxID=1123961 RepID=A0ABS0F5U7_9BACL|nr:sodium:proton antiporter [Alicyclobacillus mali (ex Roth et al. 2021)]MBF8378638.1 sodium:proton antiporter [Alicyclobacillus mali (ex Roth et al. 2021)]MCL6489460.1 sodium:proton antiporter [Alicyclobacillus mali (ex Roth et al. 2021)]